MVEIANHFCAWKPTKDEKPCQEAHASQMFDVLNKITVDAIVSPKSSGERELAAFHFLMFFSRDLLLQNRGYPAHYLFMLALSMEANFLSTY